ncbi:MULTISPECIES: AbrB family transcriptional regulator [unclassified Yoonia]|uniref:AbrB family transcriptional regulator n=1 Tax=unclassified Yoonia TaxID=2629118 RepID=UPI002AFF59E6|nr:MULTISPECIES: AbrB family transcriptional regulator [unclassified Yoonia]
MTVAAQVGLTFTPAAFASLLNLAPLIVGLAVVSGILASLVAIILARSTEMRLAQAFVSTFPTSPVEAAVIAERLGIAPAPVVVAQTIRIAIIVFLVPMAIYLIDGVPDAATFNAPQTLALGHAGLAVLAIAGTIVFKLLRLSNPYFLGPLAVSAAVAAFGVALPPFPLLIMALAQIALGTRLGSTFRRTLFTSGEGHLLATSISALALLMLISGMALGVAHLAGHPWETLVLGAAPGGVTEMALTAKFLGAEVALVTAIQLTRIFLFMPNIPWIVRLIDQRETRRRG